MQPSWAVVQATQPVEMCPSSLVHRFAETILDMVGVQVNLPDGRKWDPRGLVLAERLHGQHFYNTFGRLFMEKLTITRMLGL